MQINKLITNYRGRLIVQAYKHWLSKGEKVVDVGCGNGLIAEFLIRNLKVQIIGCDVKNYLTTNIPFVNLKENKLPLPNKSLVSIFPYSFSS